MSARKTRTEDREWRAGLTPRQVARALAFQVVYQAEATGDGYGATWTAVAERHGVSEDQRALVADVVRLLDARAGEVDEAIAAAATHWPLPRMAATDRAVLRTAVAELMARPGTPARVVLDEAIELARAYGSEESGAFVNGVLDRAARGLRPGEIG